MFCSVMLCYVLYMTKAARIGRGLGEIASKLYPLHSPPLRRKKLRTALTCVVGLGCYESRTLAADRKIVWILQNFQHKHKVSEQEIKLADFVDGSSKNSCITIKLVF